MYVLYCALILLLVLSAPVQSRRHVSRRLHTENEPHPAGLVVQHNEHYTLEREQLEDAHNDDAEVDTAAALLARLYRDTLRGFSRTALNISGIPGISLKDRAARYAARAAERAAASDAAAAAADATGEASTSGAGTSQVGSVMLAAENPDSTVDELEYLKGVQGDSGAQGSLTYAQDLPGSEEFPYDVAQRLAGAGSGAWFDGDTGAVWRSHSAADGPAAAHSAADYAAASFADEDAADDFPSTANSAPDGSEPLSDGPELLSELLEPLEGLEPLSETLGAEIDGGDRADVTLFGAIDQGSVGGSVTPVHVPYVGPTHILGSEPPRSPSTLLLRGGPADPAAYGTSDPLAADPLAAPEPTRDGDAEGRQAESPGVEDRLRSSGPENDSQGHGGSDDGLEARGYDAYGDRDPNDPAHPHARSVEQRLSDSHARLSLPGPQRAARR